MLIGSLDSLLNLLALEFDVDECFHVIKPRFHFTVMLPLCYYMWGRLQSRLQDDALV